MLDRNPMMAKEHTLVAQAVTGDEKAWAELVRQHGTRAYRIAFAILRDPAEAEDVVQDSLLTAFRSLHTLNDPKAFSVWLSRIVANRARDLLRKKQRERESFRLLPELTVNDPQSGINWETLALRQAIDSLPEIHRLVLLLHYAEEYKTAEIGQIVDRPSGTVRRILSEAYQMLREALGEEVSSS